MKNHRSALALLVVPVVVLATLASGGSPVSACTCETPPHWGFLGPEIGRLPANAVGVLWYLPPDWSAERSAEEIDRLIGNLRVEILRANGYTERAVEVVRYSDPLIPARRSLESYFLVAPAEGFTPGETYRFTDHSDEKWQGDWPAAGQRQVVVTVDRHELTPDARLKLSLTAPAIDEELSVRTGGSCSRSIRASNVQATTKVLTSGIDWHWHRQLLHRTLVDGQVWAPRSSLCQFVPPGRSWAREAGKDLIYSECGWKPGKRWSPDISRPSMRTLKMEALLPGTDVVVETATVAVDLRCTDTGK